MHRRLGEKPGLYGDRLIGIPLRSLTDGRRTAAFAGIAVVVALSRWMLAPRYLYYFDSVNFAMALDHFDPALHQPQPPGYPFFVAFTWLLHWFIPSAEHVFLVAGIIAATAAVVLVWRLGEELFSPAAGFLAAVLLLFNPAFWFGGITNQVRLFLALGAPAVMLLAWRGCRPGSPVRWLYGAALALGLASGFRPAMLVFFAPLLLFTALAGRRAWRQCLAAAAVLGAATASWLIVTVAVVGGPSRWLDLLWSYSNSQFAGSSLAFGADSHSAWDMLRKAVVWNGLGVLSWIWAAPFALRSRPASGWRLTAGFLAAAFLPAFLFHATIHIGDPDHALATVPTLCLLGGLTLATFLERRGAGRRACIGVTAAAGLLNVLVFFVPPGRVAAASSYRAVKGVNRSTVATFNAIRELEREGPVLLVSYNSPVTWRHLSYYFPQNWLVVLHSDPGQRPHDGAAWLFHERRVHDLTLKDGAFLLPARARIVWLLPDRGHFEILARTVPVKLHGPVGYTDVPAGKPLRFGEYRFVLARPL
jgi:4-amino-4-deoxy-L-arabinose transferase-like glycosyltransferase